MKITDDFNGDTPRLIECIKALIEMNDAGVLVPHGIGGHARGLLSAAAVRLAAAPPATKSADESRVVPVEPAEADILRMVDAFYASNGDVKEDMRAVYAAAISAAPPPPATQADDSLADLPPEVLRDIIRSHRARIDQLEAPQADARDAARFEKLCDLLSEGNASVYIDNGHLGSMRFMPSGLRIFLDSAIDRAQESGNG